MSSTTYGSMRRSTPIGAKIGLWAFGTFVALIVLFIIWPFYSVSAGYVGVKTWFSKPETVTLSPGIHFVMPIAESVYQINVQPNTVSTTETASTSDQQDVSTGVSVTYSVNPASAVAMFENYRDLQTLESTVFAPIISNDTKAVTAEYNAQELITKRGQVRSEIEALIRQDLAQPQYNVASVLGVNITNFSYSDDYNAAINAKQVAQQAALQEQYKLQQVQVSAQQQVATAQAQAEAAVDVAQGQAKATVLQAQADAEAYTLKQKSLTPELVELALINKWDGTMPTYTSSALPTTIFGINQAALSAAASPAP